MIPVFCHSCRAGTSRHQEGKLGGRGGGLQGTDSLGAKQATPKQGPGLIGHLFKRKLELQEARGARPALEPEPSPVRDSTPRIYVRRGSEPEEPVIESDFAATLRAMGTVPKRGNESSDDSSSTSGHADADAADVASLDSQAGGGSVAGDPAAGGDGGAVPAGDLPTAAAAFVTAAAATESAPARVGWSGAVGGNDGDGDDVGSVKPPTRGGSNASVQSSAVSESVWDDVALASESEAQSGGRSGPSGKQSRRSSVRSRASSVGGGGGAADVSDVDDQEELESGVSAAGGLEASAGGSVAGGGAAASSVADSGGSLIPRSAPAAANAVSEVHVMRSIPFVDLTERAQEVGAIVIITLEEVLPRPKTGLLARMLRLANVRFHSLYLKFSVILK